MNNWALNGDHNGHKTRTLAELLGCEVGSNSKEFLLKAKPEDLVANQLNIIEGRESFQELQFPFAATIENGSKNVFLTQEPANILKQPNMTDIPFMIGCNSNEGILTFFNKSQRTDFYEKNPEHFIPFELKMPADSQEAKDLGLKIKQFYFGNKNISSECNEPESLMQPMCDVMSDIYMNNAIYMSAELHSRFQKKSTTFVYQFSFVGERNAIKKAMNLLDVPGACHGDELYYLFSSSRWTPEEVNVGSKEDKMRKTMVKLWTNFAKFGNPTPNDDLGFIWSSVKATSELEDFELDYLDIDVNPAMKKNPNKERVEFWKELFKQYNGDCLTPCVWKHF